MIQMCGMQRGANGNNVRICRVGRRRYLRLESRISSVKRANR
jgi:hypothetical protein